MCHFHGGSIAVHGYIHVHCALYIIVWLQSKVKLAWVEKYRSEFVYCAQCARVPCTCTMQYITSKMLELWYDDCDCVRWQVWKNNQTCNYTLLENAAWLTHIIMYQAVVSTHCIISISSNLRHTSMTLFYYKTRQHAEKEIDRGRRNSTSLS